MDELSQVAIQIAMGVGLAACAGLRAFLPLFVVSLASALGWVPLADRLEWLGTWPAVLVFGVAVLTETAADKLPVVDHFLDAVESLVKPVAGALLAVAVLTDLAPLEATVLGIIAGGATAGAVHLGKSNLRLVSTGVTAGVANPLLSVLEDVLALAGSVLSLVFPLFVLALGLVAALVIFRLRRRRLRVAG